MHGPLPPRVQSDMASKHEPDNGWEYIAALAGSLAHEIKNPLSTINLNLQLLQEDWADPKTQKERRTLRKLEVLQRETERLRQTLEDFLRLVRAQKPQKELLDINDLVAEIAEFVEPELARAKIDLVEQYSPGLPKCMADPKLLKQALLNVILNAQQATPQGGQIILRTSSSQGLVHVEVIDTGHGIDERIRSKVFDAFFSTKEDGSGLGLPMTKRILEQHGGTVRFQTAPGKGTDFVLSLPAIGPDAPGGVSQ